MDKINEMKKILERRALHAGKDKGPLVTDKIIGAYSTGYCNNIIIRTVEFRYENGVIERLELDEANGEICLYVNETHIGGWNIIDGKICYC